MNNEKKKNECLLSVCEYKKYSELLIKNIMVSDF